MRSEKTYCKVYSIDTVNRSAVIQFFLPKGESLRILKEVAYKQLEDLKLDYDGAEFYFVAYEDKDGNIGVNLRRYEQSAKEKHEMDKMFADIARLIK
jgi:hypothetical protein